MPEREPLLAGLDFSGSQQPGKGTWLALGRDRRPSRGPILVEECLSAEELVANDRQASSVYNRLVQHLVDRSPKWIGADFPFALARSSMNHRDWLTFAQSLPRQFSSPDELRAFARTPIALEPKRRTDIESRAPFAPTNLRVYKQTFHGICNVLLPLILHGATIVPMMPVRQGSPLCIMEVCPACRLQQTGWKEPYKGSTRRAARRKLLGHLPNIAQAKVAIAKHLEERFIEQAGGDAIDAVLALLITADAQNVDHARLRRDPDYRIEGYIYT